MHDVTLLFFFEVSNQIAHGTAHAFKHRGHLFCRRHLDDGVTEVFIDIVQLVYNSSMIAVKDTVYCGIYPKFVEACPIPKGILY